MSQEQQILKHLKRGDPITPLEALKLYGCLRLGGRVYDLRSRGHDILTSMVWRGGKRVAQYWMIT